MIPRISQTLYNVLSFIADGYSHKAIARELGLSKLSVDTYVKRLKEYFADEPEMLNVDISSEKALVVIAQRILDKGRISSDPQQYLPGWIYRISIEGNPMGGIKQAKALTQLLWGQARNAPSSRVRDATYREIAHLLNVEGWALSAVSGPGVIYTARTRFVSQLRRIGDEYHNAEIYGMVNHHLGNAHYIVGNHARSVRFLRRAEDAVQDLGDKLCLHRTLASDYSFSPNENRSRFEEERTEVRKLIDTGEIPEERQVEALEAIARGLVRLNSPKEALDTLQEAKKILSRMALQGKDSPLRKIQVVRAELEMVRKFEPGNKRLAIKLGDEANLLFGNYNYYPRLQASIQGSLNSLN